jgi:hypothetical protein
MRPLGALVLVCCSMMRADDASAWRQAGNSLSSTAIRAHVEYLTDDLLEGRRAGSRGEALAARYVASQLEADGFKIERKVVPLAVAQVKSARLLATRGNVTVELKPGVDFALLSAPRKEHLDEAPKVLEWSEDAGARGASGLVKGGPAGPIEIAIAPAAQAQTQGATLRVQADLDLGAVDATIITAHFAGREKCVTGFAMEHDSFGPKFPGAMHAATVAVNLEMARGLAISHLTPRCGVMIVSRGDGEWIAGAEQHGGPPMHSPRDRITRDWDWEALKKKAQDALLRAGEDKQPSGAVN